MGILKGLFQKKESSCCDVKIVEIKEETKVEAEANEAQKGSSCCGK
ncbi:MAG TPA: hypothetical protein VE710_20065 [Candidatus Bathyarchaeia archaeon]|nr:hypothetical protein [Candidatus Bathyarchaeia archaeon]